MSTIPGAFLLCASSPYSRRGELWNAYKNWFGDDEAPALVWRAATRTMNPTVPQRLIDKALEEDPARAGAEYLAEFRSDIETFVSREVVEAAVVPGRHELPWQHGVKYFAFCDPSGAAADSFTLAISHRDHDGKGVLDLIRERRPPFSPAVVTVDFADLLKEYRVSTVTAINMRASGRAKNFPSMGLFIRSPTSRSPASTMNSWRR
jgi:hypothetical protein